MGCVPLSCCDAAVNLCTSVCVDTALSSECVHRAGAAGPCGDTARDVLKWARGTHGSREGRVRPPTPLPVLLSLVLDLGIFS